MTQKYTNNTNLSLSVAVFLATDLYDHNSNPNTISVTTLIKSIKQIVLGSRVPPDDYPPDVASLIKSQVGTAVHTAVEHAWLNNYERAMTSLGYSEDVIKRVRINPCLSQLAEYEKQSIEVLPIYLEQRAEKQVGDFTVSGKFDLVIDGVVEDIKNTSVYTYIYKTKDKDYQLQGSIYKWLNPDIITADYMLIQYFFSDWSKSGKLQNPKNYPPAEQIAYKIPLLSYQETEAYVTKKVNDIRHYWDKPESEIPQCTDEELWRSATVWKYYKNPKSTGRSTKNFDTMPEAYARLAADGNVGKVVEYTGQAKACLYCPAFPICKQKDAYFIS